MAQPPTRNLLAIIFKNFIDSLRPRQVRGTLKGTDHFGNRYYEIPANPSIGKRRTNRWFEPPEKDNFEQELSVEWEAWLRGRRNDPPQPDELARNLAAMQLRKRLGAQVDKKGSQIAPLSTGMESFPKRPEYETAPGKNDGK